jgi:hypothetical protein
LAFKDFSAGDILTAVDVDNYLMRQSVMVFSDSTARGSALGTAIVTEGMVTYLTGTNDLEYYDGSAWVDVSTSITGGTAGQAYVSNGTATPAFGNVTATYVTTPVGTVSAAYTAVAADRNEVILANGTVAYTITVPDVLNLGDRIDIVRDNSGTVTIAAGTGVTTWAGAGTAGTAVTFKMDEQYNAATVLKVAANSYRVIGKITV